MQYFIHCWNDNKDKIMAPKAQPFYSELAKIISMEEKPIMFGFTNISDTHSNKDITEYLDDKFFGKMREYDHVGIFKISKQNRVFAYYFWSIVLGYCRSGGDLNNIKDPDVIQTIDLMKANTSWISCSPKDELDLLICYEDDAELFVELDKNRFFNDIVYCENILKEFNLFKPYSIGRKIKINDPYKKEFIK